MEREDVLAVLAEVGVPGEETEESSEAAEEEEAGEDPASLLMTLSAPGERTSSPSCSLTSASRWLRVLGAIQFGWGWWGWVRDKRRHGIEEDRGRRVRRLGFHARRQGTCPCRACRVWR